jgi:hypothetical protein
MLLPPLVENRLISIESSHGPAARPGGWGPRSRRSAVPVETTWRGRWLGETTRHRGRFGSRFRPAVLFLQARRLPSTFTVSSVGDALDPATRAPVPGTLRRAIQEADATAGRTVDFDPSVFFKASTIALSPAAGQLELSASMTIQGPAAFSAVRPMAEGSTHTV